MKSTTRTILSALAVAAVAVAPLAAFAQTTATVNASAHVGAPVAGQARANATAHADAKAHPNADGRMRDASSTPGDRGATMQQRGATEIDKRIDQLQKLSARVSGMKRLSDSEKTAVSANLATAISSLTTLKAKIATETGDALKADMQSIAKAYRVYLLVLPQAAVTAAADRELAISAQFEAESVKLQARIDAAQAAGTDVSALTSALSDMNAKVADAKVQAQAAIDLVATLSPDDGDQATLTANTAALKSARAKLQAGQTDLKAARKDMATIVGGVKGKGEATGEVKASSPSPTVRPHRGKGGPEWGRLFLSTPSSRSPIPGLY